MRPSPEKSLELELRLELGQTRVKLQDMDDSILVYNLFV